MTPEQAFNTTVFHVEGPNKCRKWRRNGHTKTWKTRHNDFRIPVKYGMGYTRNDYDYVTQDNVHLMHAEQDCPRTLAPKYIKATFGDTWHFDNGDDTTLCGITFFQPDRMTTIPSYTPVRICAECESTYANKHNNQ